MANNRKSRRAQLHNEIKATPKNLPGKKEFDQALALVSNKEYAKAEELLMDLIKKHPNIPPFFSLLSEAEGYMGKLQESLFHIREAIRMDEENPKYMYIMGKTLASMGKSDKALIAYKRSYELVKDTKTGHELATMAIQGGEKELSLEILNEVDRMDPNNAGIQNDIGLVLLSMKKYEESERYLRRAHEINPNDPNPLINLGTLLESTHRKDEAIETFELAIKVEPGHPGPHLNLGNIYIGRGDFEKGIKLYKRTMELDPNYTAGHSNYLFATSYAGTLGAEERLKAHQEWFVRHGAKFMPASVAFELDRDPDRVLKIGYISPDFRQHSVSHFILPILRAHNRENVDVHCFSITPHPDDITKEIIKACDHWHNISGLPAIEIIERIRKEKIDILIDLAGHTGSSAIGCFVLRPAPIQATYIGYMATTGLPCMDYWITDWNIHPKDTIELTTEEIYRLPRCWMCYSPKEGSPDVSPPPVLSGEPFTFGSFNSAQKISKKTIELWSAVLKRVPNSRLHLKSRFFGDYKVKERISEMFSDQGIDESRITMEVFVESALGHLGRYAKMDIALDTTPMTGGTTTSEALWMGVPVLTLAGKFMPERMSTSLLTAVGLDDWIAKTEEEFIEKAVKFSEDHELLKDLRSRQREMMKKSELMDDAGMVKALEDGFRDMWHRLLDTTK